MMKLQNKKFEDEVPQVTNPALRLKFIQIYDRSKTRLEPSQINVETKESFSLEDITKIYEARNFKDKIFLIRSDIDQYMQIKFKLLKRKDEDMVMLQFIDISKSILLDIEKASNQILEMVNACVSHEMRNPLNSIVA
jgi:signal transduction histidine kinase